VNHPQKNILVYATSNRRHFVKEDVNNRMGTELFVNDSIQETMSLAARFGLTITFQKPMKDLYLEIVGQLADRYGLKKDRKELLKEAEAFAIRSSGRSPRTAKQFIETVKINENIK
jgi:predicted AAA+ superfamily ATPase